MIRIKPHNVLIFTILLFFLSCSSKITTELNKAESIISENLGIDSAFAVLNKLLPTYPYMENKDKAKFGMLYFVVLNKKDMNLEPVEFIDYSIDYYTKKRKDNELACCYLYKARMYLSEDDFKQSAYLLLKASELAKKTDYSLNGKIYFDLGRICYYQDAYDNAADYYETALDYFEKAAEIENVATTTSCLGEIQQWLGNYDAALIYFDKALAMTTDSTIHGNIYYHLSENYFSSGDYSTAVQHLKESLKYKSITFNHSLKLFSVAETYFYMAEYDSAMHYAQEALLHPSNIDIKKECYRLLKDIPGIPNERLAFYLSQYDVHVDSILKTAVAPAINDLVDLYESELAVSKLKTYNFLLYFSIAALFAAVYLIYRYLNKRLRKQNKAVIKAQKKETNLVLERKRILSAIQSERAVINAAVAIPPSKKERQIKAVYSRYLYTDSESGCLELMNRLFDSKPYALQKKNDKISNNELLYICLLLFKISTKDIHLVLGCKQESIKKLRYRLSLKFELESSKDLNCFLSDFFESTDLVHDKNF